MSVCCMPPGESPSYHTLKKLAAFVVCSVFRRAKTVKFGLQGDVSAQSYLCGQFLHGFPTNLLHYLYSFQKQACKLCFFTEQNRFDTILVALLLNWMPHWSNDQNNARWLNVWWIKAAAEILLFFTVLCVKTVFLNRLCAKILSNETTSAEL